MPAEPLLSVAEIREWMAIPQRVKDAAEQLKPAADGIRQVLGGVYTSVPVGIYFDGETKTAYAVGDSGWAPTDQDFALVKSAVSLLFPCRALPRDAVRPGVKVAYSPFLRELGTDLNFFPGKYPGGIPNSPGPLQSMLTSGLVGAGLGYGIGSAAETILPRSWQHGRLRKTLAMLGGMSGPALGATWGMTNLANGRGFNDNSLLAGGPVPKLAEDLGKNYKAAVAKWAGDRQARMIAAVKDAAGDTFDDNPDLPPHTSLDVNIDAMGRTLWESGSSPQTAGMTMGALAAAHQMPGGDRPGWVTPTQMGNLAAHMGVGYFSGALVGSALGLLTGLPEEAQDKLKSTGMYVGLVRALVPKLFGDMD